MALATSSGLLEHELDLALATRAMRSWTSMNSSVGTAKKMISPTSCSAALAAPSLMAAPSIPAI
jgi:hypothetical protein